MSGRPRVGAATESGRCEHAGVDRILFGVLEFAHQRYPRAEVFDRFLRVQEPADDQVPAFAVRRNAFHDLLEWLPAHRAESWVAHYRRPGAHG
jgi:hypothetical protein